MTTDWHDDPRWLRAPKQLVSELPRALDLLTLGTFRLRLEMCLDRNSQPFFVQVDCTGGETTVSVL